MTGSKSKKEFVPYEKAYGRPIEDMMRRVPNLERISKAIGWKAKTSFDNGLKTTIDWYTANKGRLHF
jgi:UDP-glucose 4-epimerase